MAARKGGKDIKTDGWQVRMERMVITGKDGALRGRRRFGCVQWIIKIAW